jgi:hypothetical protein
MMTEDMEKRKENSLMKYLNVVVDTVHVGILFDWV